MSKSREYLLMTVMHTGTRSVKNILKDSGHTVLYQHCVPAGLKWIGKFPKQITTVRNPYNVAASWLHHNEYNRFDRDDWESQWSMWRDIVKHHKFAVIVIENWPYQVVGKAKFPPPEQVDMPVDKVQFALNMIQSVSHLIKDCPQYKNPWSK